MSTSTQSNRKDGGPAALPGYPIEVSRCRIAANFPLKKGNSLMTIKNLWPLVYIFLLLTTVPSCGNGSSTVPPPPSKPAFLYAVTLSGPPSAVFQLATFKVDSSTGTLSSPTTTALPSLIVPQVAVDPLPSSCMSPTFPLTRLIFSPSTRVPAFRLRRARSW
jgi:hypothetical protein